MSVLLLAALDPHSVRAAASMIGGYVEFRVQDIQELYNDIENHNGERNGKEHGTSNGN